MLYRGYIQQRPRRTPFEVDKAQDCTKPSKDFGELPHNWEIPKEKTMNINEFYKHLYVQHNEMEVSEHRQLTRVCT